MFLFRFDADVAFFFSNFVLVCSVHLFLFLFSLIRQSCLVFDFFNEVYWIGCCVDERRGEVDRE